VTLFEEPYATEPLLSVIAWPFDQMTRAPLMFSFLISNKGVTDNATNLAGKN
jgi:hypothetical protein